MKSKNIRKKLTLNKETIAILSDGQLGYAKGGINLPPEDPSRAYTDCDHTCFHWHCNNTYDLPCTWTCPETCIPNCGAGGTH